jgi:hypothetical protein
VYMAQITIDVGALMSLEKILCWIIWKERNARIFDANKRSPSCLVGEIKNQARLWCQAGNKTLARIIGVLHSE